MKILDESTVTAVSGGERWGFLHLPIQIPDGKFLPHPLPIVPIFN